MGASAPQTGLSSPTEPQSTQGLGPPGFDPLRVVHLRNGRAAKHGSTFGDGKTWCGKKLIGKPDSVDGAIATFTVYGNQIDVTFDLDQGTCERCRAALDEEYRRAFPEGPKPIATFKLDNPEDVERAKSVLSPEALNRFFGPGGGGMAAFDAALRDSDRSGEAAETGNTGSTEGESAGPQGIAQPEVPSS